MLIVTAIAAAVTSYGIADVKPISCPIMGSAAAKTGSAIDYAGVRYRFCCGGCDATFAKDPAAALKNPKLKDLVTGVSLFDPVAQQAVSAATAKGGSSDYGGVRFYFLNRDNKAAFDADPKRYGTIPPKEAMFCPVMKTPLANYYGTAGYVDYEGVRYYVCCGGCFGALKANAAAFVANAKNYVKVPKALNVSAELAKVTGF